MLPFILANLSVGLTISTIAKTQLEASQTSIFSFCHPCCCQVLRFHLKVCQIAQAIGNVLPLTHFNQYCARHYVERNRSRGSVGGFVAAAGFYAGDVGGRIETV